MNCKIVSVMLMLLSSAANAQIVDIDYSTSGSLGVVADEPTQKTEILKNGFVDVLSNGGMQASARLLKLNIGNPNGFYMPFYIYTGASGNSLGDNKQNQTLISNLLNPVGGSLNVSFNGLQQLVKPKPYRKINFAYQIGAKITNGEDTLRNENVNFVNGFLNLGLFFQTQAWAASDPKEMGVFWIQGKFIANVTSQNKLETVFYNIEDSYFYGYSLDAGIEINRVVNLKLGVYQYLNNTDIDLLKDPMVKFSVDYTLAK